MLIRGLVSKTAAGFRSRRGGGHDRIPVSPHHAPFSSYKNRRRPRQAEETVPSVRVTRATSRLAGQTGRPGLYLGGLAAPFPSRSEGAVTEQRVQRRLAAILAADVVGYSALMQRAEEATYAEFERLKRELIEPS